MTELTSYKSAEEIGAKSAMQYHEEQNRLCNATEGDVLKTRLALLHLDVAHTALAVASSELANAAPAMTRRLARHFEWKITQLQSDIVKARLDLISPPTTSSKPD